MANNRYHQIVEEIETGNLQKDLWLQAWEKSSGNRSKATSLYITLRANQLYKEDTAFYTRAARSALHALDLRHPRTRKIVIACALALASVAFFGIQPTLQERAAEEHRLLCERARKADIKGENERYLFEKVGSPDAVDTSTSSLIYVYRPGSRFCLARKNYELRVFLDTQTGQITGWQGNAEYEMATRP